MNTPIRHFTDLDAWKEGHKLVLLIYRATKKFPNNESYGLISQIQRAAVSVTSNIAEGFSRFHYSDRARFYYISRGSLSEVQNQLLIAKDLEYLPEPLFAELWKSTQYIAIILNGLIQSTTTLATSKK